MIFYLHKCRLNDKEAIEYGTCKTDTRKSGQGFLSDPKYMGYKGFQTADTAEPYFKLLYLPFEEDASVPCFQNSVARQKDMPEGFVLYYTNQCPFTARYVPVLEEMAKAGNAVFQTVHIQTREDAQGCPSPFTTYDGQFVTHEILSEKKFDKTENYI